MFMAEALQPLLKKWWPTPKPPPPPPPPFWCQWTVFPGAWNTRWQERCWQIEWHVNVRLFVLLDWWFEALALGYIVAGILFHVPLFYFFRDIAKKHNILFSKFTVNDKGKMCLCIVAWACFLSFLPAAPIDRLLREAGVRLGTALGGGARECRSDEGVLACMNAQTAA